MSGAAVVNVTASRTVVRAVVLLMSATDRELAGIVASLDRDTALGLFEELRMRKGLIR